MNIVTDLNNRERDRYADAMDRLAKAALHAAKALRIEDDTEALIGILTLTLTLSVLDELQRVFMGAIATTTPNDLSALIPEIPETKEKTT